MISFDDISGRLDAQMASYGVGGATTQDLGGIALSLYPGAFRPPMVLAESIAIPGISMAPPVGDVRHVRGGSPPPFTMAAAPMQRRPRTASMVVLGQSPMGAIGPVVRPGMSTMTQPQVSLAARAVAAGARTALQPGSQSGARALVDPTTGQPVPASDPNATIDPTQDASGATGADPSGAAAAGSASGSADDTALLNPYDPNAYGPAAAPTTSSMPWGWIVLGLGVVAAAGTVAAVAVHRHGKKRKAA